MPEIVESEEPEVEFHATDTPSFGPSEEVLYQDTRAILMNPQAARIPPYGVLGLTLALFILSMGTGHSTRALAILVGVLFFHELGHWIGMQIFGYRDVKMFFIPFFGAAVSGKKEGAPQWQQAIVLLLGPLPGIIVGFSMLVANVFAPNLLVREVACWLVGINVFNLLPLVPLDGGRLLNLLIFSRHRVLETVFLVLTALGVMGLGLLLKSTLFTLLGIVGLIAVPSQYRIARAAELIRERWPALPFRINEASDLQLRDLFREVRVFLRARTSGTAKLCANMMKAVHERALARPVGVLASLSLLTIYGAGYALSLASVFVFFLSSRRGMPPLH